MLEYFQLVKVGGDANGIIWFFHFFFIHLKLYLLIYAC